MTTLFLVAQHYGEFLRILREEANLTQEEVAAQMGELSQSAVSKWERTKAPLHRGKMIKLAKALGLTIQQVDRRWKGEEPARPPPPGIPVINKAPAGPALSYDTDHFDEYHTAWAYVERAGIDDGGAFAVEVIEDSMEPKLQAGDILILLPVIEDQPETHPREGQVVFVRFTEESDHDGCCIGRYRTLPDGSRMLAKDNPKRSPVIFQPEHVARMGVAIEKRSKDL